MIQPAKHEHHYYPQSTHQFTVPVYMNGKLLFYVERLTHTSDASAAWCALVQLKLAVGEEI